MSDRQPGTTPNDHGLGKLIWETSRADEGTISVTGANIVAQAILASDTVVDDDVPTNAERLTPFIAAVIREAALGAEHSEGADYWAKRLDLAGVRAPETVSEIRSQALREAAHDFDHNIGVSSTDDEGADELHHNEFVAFLENLAEGG